MQAVFPLVRPCVGLALPSWRPPPSSEFDLMWLEDPLFPEKGSDGKRITGASPGTTKRVTRRTMRLVRIAAPQRRPGPPQAKPRLSFQKKPHVRELGRIRRRGETLPPGLGSLSGSSTP